MTRKVFNKDGELHCVDAPALEKVTFVSQGHTTHREFWVNGEKQSETDTQSWDDNGQ